MLRTQNEQWEVELRDVADRGVEAHEARVAEDDDDAPACAHAKKAVYCHSFTTI
jgi:hypothetical protein